MAIVQHSFQFQTDPAWCGPASTRAALSAGGVLLSQQQVATELGTTDAGTDSIHDVTRVLNAHLDGYADVILPTTITQQDVDIFRARMVSTVDGHGAGVVNGAGNLQGLTTGAHTYAGGHYVAITGYDDAGNLWVSDVAAGEYWATASAVAHWAAAGGFRGYAYREDNMLKDEQLPRAQRDAATALDDLYGQEMHGASNFDGAKSDRTVLLERVDANVAAIKQALTTGTPLPAADASPALAPEVLAALDAAVQALTALSAALHA